MHGEHCTLFTGRASDSFTFHIQHSRLSILGIPIDRVTRVQAVVHIQHWLKGSGQYHVATPNPEMLVEAQRNPQFKDLLQRTHLNIADGAGILWAAKRLGQPLAERVTGVDVMLDTCATVDSPVFLLGAWNDTAKRAAEALKKRNPRITIAGTYAGSPSIGDESSLVERINASGAQLLFVAYGSPGQEFWIGRNLHKMPSVRVAMGVGGAFDFISGTKKRAPGWMQTTGLEWLFRLAREPSRFPRIWNAIIVFPRLVRRWR